MLSNCKKSNGGNESFKKSNKTKISTELGQNNYIKSSFRVIQEENKQLQRTNSGRDLRLKHLKPLSQRDIDELSKLSLTPKAPSRSGIKSINNNNNNKESKSLDKEYLSSLELNRIKQKSENNSNMERKIITKQIENNQSINKINNHLSDLIKLKDEYPYNDSEKFIPVPETHDYDVLFMPPDRNNEPIHHEFSLWKKTKKTIKKLPSDAILFTPEINNQLDNEVYPYDETYLYDQTNDNDENNDLDNQIDNINNNICFNRSEEDKFIVMEQVIKEKKKYISIINNNQNDLKSESFILKKSLSPKMKRTNLINDMILYKDNNYLNILESKQFYNHTINKIKIHRNELKKCINSWKKGEIIGSGTFGKVYTALNSETGELFAVKEIDLPYRKNDMEHKKKLSRLEEEILLMKCLDHKHIVRYRGTDRSKHRFYIFMEFVPGGSIASLLERFDVFNEDLIRLYIKQILLGVQYLHSRGIIHRDIKGANVLVNEKGIAKLADFGCSKQLHGVQTNSLEESLKSIRGSVPWMAPEVVKQSGHDFKADIWSIGATMIEMATAKHPWPSLTNNLSVMYTIATTTKSPPIPSHLSNVAKSFLNKCFRIDPKERSTATELLLHPFINKSDL